MSQSTSPSHVQNHTPSSSASWFVPIENPKCRVCAQDEDMEDVIACEKCNNIFHISCTKLPTYELVKYRKKNLYKRKFVCRECIEKLHSKDCQAVEAARLSTDSESETEASKLRKDLRACQEELKKKEDTIEKLLRKIQKLEDNATKQQDSGEVRQEEEEEIKPDKKEEERRQFVEELKNIIRDETKDMMKNFHERLEKIEAKNNEKQGPEDRTVENLPPQEEEQQQETDEEEKDYAEELRKIVREETEQALRQRETAQVKQQNPNKQRFPNRKTACYNCGKIGHLARNCYHRFNRFNAPRFNRFNRRDDMSRFRTMQFKSSNEAINVIPLHQLARNTETYIPHPSQQPQAHHQQYQQYPQQFHTQSIPVNQQGTYVYEQPVYRPHTFPSIPPTNF